MHQLRNAIINFNGKDEEPVQRLLDDGKLDLNAPFPVWLRLEPGFEDQKVKVEGVFDEDGKVDPTWRADDGFPYHKDSELFQIQQTCRVVRATALQLACHMGHGALISSLLNDPYAGCKVNMKNEDGQAALHVMARRVPQDASDNDEKLEREERHKSLIKILVEDHMADTELTDGDNMKV